MKGSIRSHDRKLFFALWPNEELRSQLAPLTELVTKRAGGDAVRPLNLHITLAFLGTVPRERRPELAEIAARLAGEAVEINLTDIEHWADVKVAALVSNRPSAALLQFARSLHAELDARGLHNHGYAYRPHVTLAKNVEHDLMPSRLPEAIRWRSDRFGLVESVPVEGSTEYRVIDAWPLGEEAMQPSLFPSG